MCHIQIGQDHVQPSMQIGFGQSKVLNQTAPYDQGFAIWGS